MLYYWQYDTIIVIMYIIHIIISDKDVAVFNVARFLFEYHSHRFESLYLPQLPADRSDFDVHGALLDDKVQKKCHTLRFNKYRPLLCLNNLLYVL
jgi:hypothetical protein